MKTPREVWEYVKSCRNLKCECYMYGKCVVCEMDEVLATPSECPPPCIICGGTKKDLRFAEQGSTADDCPDCPNCAKEKP